MQWWNTHPAHQTGCISPAEAEESWIDSSLVLPLRIKETSHKMPNLDGIVKSHRKQWNEANLWSQSKFLLLLPTGFFSTHMLPMWPLESEMAAAEHAWLSVDKTPSTAKKLRFTNPLSNLSQQFRKKRPVLLFQVLLRSFLLCTHEALKCQLNSVMARHCFSG